MSQFPYFEIEVGCTGFGRGKLRWTRENFFPCQVIPGTIAGFDSNQLALTETQYRELLCCFRTQSDRAVIAGGKASDLQFQVTLISAEPGYCIKRLGVAQEPAG